MHLIGNRVIRLLGWAVLGVPLIAAAQLSAASQGKLKGLEDLIFIDSFETALSPPTISTIANQQFNEDSGSGVLSFSVAGMPPLIVTANSSDQALIADANIILGGSGTNRTIGFIPEPNANGGPILMTLQVSDGTQSAQSQFEVLVSPVNDAPILVTLGDQTHPLGMSPQIISIAGWASVTDFGAANESGQMLDPNGFTISNFSDPAGVLLSVPLLENSGILTYLLSGASGSATFEVTARDDGGTANGGVDSSLPQFTTITLLDTLANSAPIADAGSDQTVYGGSDIPLLLLGERSADPDGTITAASWQQISGLPAILRTQSNLNREYFPPAVGVETQLLFQLTITDDDGATDVDFLSVTVLPASFTATVTRDSGVFDPSIFLFTTEGNQIMGNSGDGSSISFAFGAGVRYVVATADSSIDMTITITGPDGLLITSMTTTASLNQIGQPFLSIPDLFSSGNIAHLFVMAKSQTAEAPIAILSGHPQLVEIALPHPDPGLRDPDRFLSFMNHTAIGYQEDVASAAAYYRAVDPDKTRTTLNDWLQETGFTANGANAHAIYKNDADLGFGRDMYMRKNPDLTVAGYVRNFPSLDHTLANQDLIATVAMEFGPTDGHPDKYTKFFVFSPDGERQGLVDLDGRGPKAVPGVCNVCHGGAPKATFLDDGGIATYPDQGDTGAQFLPWDLDTFIYSDQPGLSRGEQETAFYDLNQLAKATYPTGPVSGVRWTGAVAIELIDRWYRFGPVFNGELAPDDWNIARDLYLDVVAPNCRACHIMRGNNKQNAIDFSSYAKFIGYAPLIKELVFDQGVMPLASRTFGHFWQGGEDSPAATLAQALGMASLRKPGRPVARTGMLTDGVRSLNIVRGNSLGALLDGRNSLFASEQSWSVISLSGIPETLEEFGNQAITHDTPADDSTFFISRQIAPPASVHRTGGNRVGPGDPNFYEDILPLLNDSVCLDCHLAGKIPGIPILFDPSDPNKTYSDILNRINFEQPDQSLFLTKPGGLRHGKNGPISVFGSAVTDWAYFYPNGDVLEWYLRGTAAQTVSEWIVAGAPQGAIFKSDSCRAVGSPIPDYGDGELIDTLLVGPGQIGKSIIVKLKLQHSFINDLQITLSHLESGLEVTLLNRPIGIDGLSCARQEIDAWFWELGTDDFNRFCDTMPGDFLIQIPETPLAIMDGMPLNGTWQLKVEDLSVGNTGILQQWCVSNTQQ